MYKIEYKTDGEIVEVSRLSTEDYEALQNSPTTLESITEDSINVVYVEEFVEPVDKDGYYKKLYYGIKDNNDIIDENTPSTLEIKIPEVYAIYTEIKDWMEIADAKDIITLKEKTNFLNQLATDLFNDSTANGAYITEIMNSAMIGSNSTPTEVYCLKRPSTSYGGLFSDWFKSVKKINSIYIDRSDVYFTHWLMNFTGDTIGYLSIKDGVYVGEALLAWCANLCNIKIKPGCIVVKTGVSLDLSLIGNNAPSLSRDFIENIINGLGVVGNANVRLSSKIKNNMTQSDIELVTSKGWVII